MEMNGEQIIKNSQKVPKGIILGYIICIVAIIIGAFWITYKEEKGKENAIDFTENGGIGIQASQKAYMDVQGLTTEVAIYGDVENEKSYENDRYYIAFNNKYMYIIDLDYETISKLQPLQDYLYSEEENPVTPEPVRIYGKTEEIPDELKDWVLEYYNEGLDEENQLQKEEFENYFGTVLLNVRDGVEDTTIQTLIVIISIFVLVLLFASHIIFKVEKSKTKKYLKNNGYEDELAHQLDDFVENKYCKDKVIMTKDFFVDLESGGFATFKYSDVKWLYIYNTKYYGVVTIATNLMVYLKDGKTKLVCLKSNRSKAEEFMEIFDKICEKVPNDCLKGYTSENIKAFKEYKKGL